MMGRRVWLRRQAAAPNALGLLAHLALILCSLQAMVYLTSIIDHYHDLPDVMLFMHAHRLSWCARRAWGAWPLRAARCAL